MTIDRTVKGKRPVFITGETDANFNRLLAIISALSAEVAVLRERQRTIEQLLARRGELNLSDIEEFEPDLDDLAERSRWQSEFMRRVYYVLEQEAAAEADQNGSASD